MWTETAFFNIWQITLSKGEKCKINHIEIPFFHIQYWQNYKNSITDYRQYSRIGKPHSSLLKSSHCTSILSLIQLTFLLPMFWTHFLVNYLFLFHCFVFQGFLSCSFPWEQFLCLFILPSLPLCIQVKPLPTSYVGASLYRLHVSDAFRGAVGFDVDKFRLSLGCAVSSPLGGGCGWRWRGWSWRQVWGRTSLLLGDPHCPCRDRVGPQAAGAEVLRFRLTLSVFLLSVCFPSLHGDPCLSEGQC